MPAESVLECQDFKTPYHFLGFLPRELSVAATKKKAAPYNYKVVVFVKRTVDVDIQSVESWVESCKTALLDIENVACFLVPDLQDASGTDCEYLLLNHALAYKRLHYMRLRDGDESAGPMIRGYLVRAIPWYLGSHMDRISMFCVVKSLDVMPRLALADHQVYPDQHESQFMAIQGFYHYIYYLEWMKFGLHTVAALVCLSGNLEEAKDTFIYIPDDDVVDILARTLPSIHIPCTVQDMYRHAFNYWFSSHQRSDEARAVFKIVYTTLNCGISYSGQHKKFFEKQFERLASILPIELFEKRCADLIPQPTEEETWKVPVLDLSDSDVFMCTFAQLHFGVFVTSFKHNDGSHLNSKSELIRQRPEWLYVESVATLPGGRNYCSKTCDVWKLTQHPFIQTYFFPRGSGADDMQDGVPYIVWQWKSGQTQGVNFELPNPSVLQVLQAIHSVDGYYPWVSPKNLEIFSNCVAKAEEFETVHYDYLNMLATDRHGMFLNQSEFTLVKRIASMAQMIQTAVPEVYTSFIHPVLISAHVFDPLNALSWLKCKTRTSNVDQWMAAAAATADDSSAESFGCVYICQPLEIENAAGNFEILRSVNDSLVRILDAGTSRKFKVVFCISPFTEHYPVIQVLLHYVRPFSRFSTCLTPKIDLQASAHGISLLSSNVSFPNWMRQYEERQAAQFLNCSQSAGSFDTEHQMYFRELIDALPFAVDFAKPTQRESGDKITIHVYNSVRYTVEKFNREEETRRRTNKAAPSSVEVCYRFRASVENAIPIPKLVRTLCDVLKTVPLVQVKLLVQVDGDLPAETSARPCLAEISRHFL